MAGCAIMSGVPEWYACADKSRWGTGSYEFTAAAAALTEMGSMAFSTTGLYGGVAGAEVGLEDSWVVKRGQ